MLLRIWKRSAFLSFALGLGTLLALYGSAFGANLKKVQVTDSSRIDILLDSKISPKQIKTEFFGDIVQISLSDVSVYPARVTSVSGGEITKVFAYQYAPKLTRCRLTVKGGAEALKDRFEVRADGKAISIRTVQSDKAVTKAAAPVREKAEAPAEVSTAGLGDSEKALLDRVMKGPAKETAKEKDEAASDLPVVASSKKSSEKNSETRLTDGKPLPSPFRSFAMLGIVLAVFFGSVLLFKKLKSGSAPSISGSQGGLAKIIAQVGGSIKGSTKGKLIEVIANHHIGPKKSISVVRIGDRQLVLGITNDSINLITQLGESDGVSASVAQDSDFEQIAMESIRTASTDFKPQAQAPTQTGSKTRLGALIDHAVSLPQAKAPASQVQGTIPRAHAARAYSAATPSEVQAAKADFDQQDIVRSTSGVRAQIRSKLEGYKPL
ncbi:MAG: flagellar biosynthetic protein FliO [Bdellovibrionales bacterium]|nr:flagellar biosynthetic protein FliO [Bdellovibrionales bacterium]